MSSAPQAVEHAARLLYGADWQSPFARDFGLNLRTVQRLAKAAAEGTSYPIAPAVPQGMVARLMKQAASCTDAATELGQRIDPEASLAEVYAPEPTPPTVIALTADVLAAGVQVLDDADVGRPSKLARAVFLAMAETAGLAASSTG